MREAQETLMATMPDSELVWEPRDVVGGDFYHFHRSSNGWFCAVADCTGHGVPGAFMTLIASSLLAQVIDHNGVDQPARIIGSLNQEIKRLLGQDRPRFGYYGQSDDGLDGAFSGLMATGAS
jgi:serine phosphatase RsbU (regulator of sigma subunit)